MTAKKRKRAKKQRPWTPREKVHFPRFPYDDIHTLCSRPIDAVILTDDIDVVTCFQCLWKWRALPN